MSKTLSSSSYRQAATQAILRFGRAVLIACLILVADTVAADQSALPRITGKEIQSLVAKNKGKVVLLHFWASWCPPCAHEFPALVKVYTAYKPRGLEMIAVGPRQDQSESESQAA